jgi:hypothetical protein
VDAAKVCYNAVDAVSVGVFPRAPFGDVKSSKRDGACRRLFLLSPLVFAVRLIVVERRPKGWSGFVAALFDFSFHAFITPMIVEILYVVGIALSALAALLSVILTFSYAGSSIMSFLEALVGAPVIFIVCAIFSRIALEYTIAIFRIAENTESLRDRP